MLEEEFVKLMRQIIGGTTLFESSFQIPNIFLLNFIRKLFLDIHNQILFKMCYC